MRPGTKTVLFGVHQFAIHPLMVALGWYRAFGFARVRIGTDHQQHAVHDPASADLIAKITVHRGAFASLLDPRLWLAFIVHDIGLFGKPNIDGPEGETHPEVGAGIMRRLFGDVWGDLVLLHSRFYSKRLNRPVSPLCIADKWAIVVEPTWIYLPRARWSGELAEYMAHGRRWAETDPVGMTSAEYEAFLSGSARRWHGAVKSYMRRWIADHSNGKPDTWTPKRHNGVTVGGGL